MVELLLFLGTFCLLFFIPVQFRIFYRKLAQDHHLLLEMTFLNGLLKRSREIDFNKPTPPKIKRRSSKYGRWFFFQRLRKKETTQDISYNPQKWLEFLDRYRNLGLGVTLLSYFLPGKYYKWLLVTEELERRGYFQKFKWYTRYGTGEAAGTAILYGVIWGVMSSFLNLLGRKNKFKTRPDLNVIPDYQNPRLDVAFDCIFRIKLGHIIIAALMARLRQRILKGGGGIERASN